MRALSNLEHIYNPLFVAAVILKANSMFSAFSRWTVAFVCHAREEVASSSMLLISVIGAFLTWYLLIKDQRYKQIYIIWKTLPRDIRTVTRVGKVVFNLIRHKDESVPGLFQKVARRNPGKVAIYFEDETWTFKELDDLSNKVANHFKAKGLEAGDSVALLLENRPEYAAIWLGLAKIRVITALINTNLVTNSLWHSINVANCKCLVYGSDYEEVVTGISDKLAGITLYRLTTSPDPKILIPGSMDLREEISESPVSSPEEELSKIKSSDKLIYIYTSGTTGLPKAAVISSSRYLFITMAFYYGLKIRKDDVMYVCLPLYHSAGGIVSIGQTIIFGLSSNLRRKFSASNFWKDCVQYKCTVAVYIGEICRYLLAAHEGKPMIQHPVRVMGGNGLRKEIWQKFATFFKINEIYEFYGATEGNSNMVNFDGKIGAVGCVPVWLSSLVPFTLIKYDENTYEPLRNPMGSCMECKPNEPGILIGKIHQKISVAAFMGYVDKKETSKKILRDVFRKGDIYFHSGDVLVRDEYGYFYFKDRIGDTYRWKGENVATSEVESVICDVIGFKDVVVYGVQVPNLEGKAGMVAIADPEKNVNLPRLAKELSVHLPSYAVPLFLRLMDSVPLTGTFKIKKSALQNEGYDLDKVRDPLYFFDARKKEYVPLREVWEGIVTGKLRL